MSLVAMHSSWLVVNSIVGCPNNCKYCLLQDKENHKKKPQILGTPEEAIKELLNFKLYDISIPVCLFPNTDIFVNRENQSYLIEILKEIEKHQIKNVLVLITKCLIPTDIIQTLKEMQKKGYKIVIYLSYSGLGTNIEPAINHQNILINFKNLKKAKIPTIHYYRPFLPDNSKEKEIKKTLRKIHKYTPISTITGLMYVPGLLENENIWPELNTIKKEKLENAISLWPEEAWNFFYKKKKTKHFFYQTNTCALKTILKEPSIQYKDTYECKNFNHCPKAQQKRCKIAKRKSKDEILKQLDRLLKRNNKEIYKKYRATFINENELKVEGIALDVSTLSYLSYLLGIKVYTPKGEKLNKIYNSTLNGAMPFIVKDNKECKK